MAKPARMKQPDATFVGPENCWKALGIGIVRQAILDWQEATVRLSMSLNSANAQNMMKQKRSAERFLMSTLPDFYAGVDGPTLLRKMKEGRPL